MFNKMEVDRIGVSCAGGCGCCSQRCENMFCDTTQIPSFKKVVPHMRPHELRG